MITGSRHEATDRYAVMGHPVGHSRSPWIHAAFGRQYGIAISYEALDVPPEMFEAEVSAFLAAGGKGFNCTIPLKEAAFRRADVLTERALRAGAVNTMQSLADGALLGDNTDGHGLRADLEINLGISLEQARILILGAGGAARGIVAPLLERGPAALHIANRTAARALDLARVFDDLGPVTGGGMDAMDGEYDLILNATAASLSQALPPLGDGLLSREGVCYDLAYAATPTPFVIWGKEQGARISCDGLGMLVEQAALAFELWFRVLPTTQPVIEALRLSLAR
ncbi:MAG: shikimate dehydrogenase [Pseudomonadota bacterium]